jgi:hypothetical protein
VIYRGDLGMSLDELLLIEQQSPQLGGGDFGTTYLYKDMALKIINIQTNAHKRSELSANLLNKECESFTYTTVQGDEAKCACPILYGGTAEDVFKPKGKKEILWLAMPLMKRFEVSRNNIIDILSACHDLVRNGYFHNDFHMGNVMSYNDNPIIVDFGSMKKDNVTELDEITLKTLTFAQISTFLDNCNSNTICIAEFIDAFADFRNAVKKFFTPMPTNKFKPTATQWVCIR